MIRETHAVGEAAIITAPWSREYWWGSWSSAVCQSLWPGRDCRQLRSCWNVADVGYAPLSCADVSGNFGSKNCIHKPFSVFMCAWAFSELSVLIIWMGQTLSQLIKALCYKLEGRGFDSWWDNWIHYIVPNTSTGNMVLRSTQSQTYFWLVKRNRRLRITALVPFVSGLFRKCGILNISQSCGPPLPVIGIALHKKGKLYRWKPLPSNGYLRLQHRKTT
jgi:hypothetical protein